MVLRLNIDSTPEVESVMARCFDLAEELEMKFAKEREMSDVSRLNRATAGREVPVSQEFLELLPFCVELWRDSNGAFNPFKITDFETEPLTFDNIRGQGYAARAHEDIELDFSNVANGFVIDRLAVFLRNEIPEVAGEIEASGCVYRFGGHAHFQNLRAKTCAIAEALSKVVSFGDAELSEKCMRKHGGEFYSN